MMIDTNSINKNGQCSLVWEGSSNPIQANVNKKRVFDKWKLIDIRSDAEAKRSLSEKNMVHLWNMCTSFKPERAAGEEPEDVAKLLI